VAAKQKAGFKTLDELFVAVREQCEQEYKEAFGKSWAGIPDWPRLEETPFEKRAREVYENLARAVEASRKIVEEARAARAEWGRVARELEPSSFVRAMAAMTPPEAATSTTVAKMEVWVGDADRRAKERADEAASTGIGIHTDISTRPWIDSTKELDRRLIVTLHVLALARFGVVPARDGSGDVSEIEVAERATDRQAAIISLLYENRPQWAKPSWTVARVIGDEQKTMRLRVLRTAPRVLKRLGEAMVGVMEETEIVPPPQSEPRSYEEAAIVAVALSKLTEIGASAWRHVEEINLELADRARAANPAELEALVAEHEARRGHKHNG
jgi:hypothetical protein